MSKIFDNIKTLIIALIIAILIRSLLLKGKTLRANAGCGIVADSNSKSETEELNWKLMPILEALT